MAKAKPISEQVLRPLIEAGLSSVQIGARLGVTYPTVTKYAARLGLLESLHINGSARKHRSLYKDGRASYRKHKKSACELCGRSGIRLEVHHKKPVKYDASWSTIIEGDHSPENLLTVCNSCHQKTHYRDHGRRPMRSDGRRFYAAY